MYCPAILCKAQLLLGGHRRVRAPPDPYERHPGAPDQNHRHLEQYLDLVLNQKGPAIAEPLGAVSALGVI